MAMTEQQPFGALRQEDKKKTPLRVARTMAIRKTSGIRARFASACVKYCPAAIQHGLFLGGLVSVTVGFWMIYRPLGPIVGGILAVYVGMAMSVDEQK